MSTVEIEMMNELLDRIVALEARGADQERRIRWLEDRVQHPRKYQHHSDYCDVDFAPGGSE